MQTILVSVVVAAVRLLVLLSMARRFGIDSDSLRIRE
jgi:hypothetical protein